MCAPIPSVPMTKIATPIASFAPIQKTTDNVAADILAAKIKVDPKSSVESKPVVTIPKQDDDTQEQPKTPTITSPTPPQSPAAPSVQSISSTKGLSAAHETPATPPVGAPKPAKKEATKKKK